MVEQLTTPANPKSAITFRAPKEFYDLLVTPCFAPSDDPRHFKLVVERMLEEVRPVDFFEVLITLGLIDVTYQELRLRHVREAMTHVNRADAVESLLFKQKRLEFPEGAERLMRANVQDEFRGWRDNPQKRSEIEKRLNRNSGGDDFAILVQTNVSVFNNRDAIDREIASAHRRRMALLRDLDFCRDRKKKVRAVSDEIVALSPAKQQSES